MRTKSAVTLSASTRLLTDADTFQINKSEVFDHALAQAIVKRRELVAFDLELTRTMEPALTEALPMSANTAPDLWQQAQAEFVKEALVAIFKSLCVVGGEIYISAEADARLKKICERLAEKKAEAQKAE